MPHTDLLVVVAIILIGVFFLVANLFFGRKKKKIYVPFFLNRSTCNPIINPNEHPHWEVWGAFNPAAIMDDSGRVHIFYRAVGADGVSRVGYASSPDGTKFDEYSPYPVFSFQNINRKTTHGMHPDPVLYPSGASWGGCEDPRAVRIDGRIYMTFNAFDGWDFIRIGLTSISEEDFLAKRWNWKKTVLISPPGEVHKNWIIFPEKIKGKYAILHSISPEIRVDYRDTLESIGSAEPHIDSPKGPRTKGREDFWDNTVRGAGPPPVKTKKGWLLFYHGVDKRESHKYKLGVFLLDLENPEKVIARSSLPILEPDEWYENDGKPGIVYACGAIIKNGVLYLYYGGGDKYVCSAGTNVDELLAWLLKHGKVRV